MGKRIFGFVQSKMDGTEVKFTEQKGLEIPEEYSYVEFLPKVLDQGLTSTCVPCSISGHLNWNANVDNATDNKKDHNIRIYDIYNSRSNSGEGMSFKEALKYLRHHGVKSDLGNIKIDKYATVGVVNALKQALILNGPCIGGLPVYNDSGIEKFWDKTYGKTMLGGHAICIAGYTKDGFIIRNSWGTSYGKNGYGILPYKDFSSFCEIWTIID